MSEIFIQVMDMAHRLGVKEINKLPGCWEVQVDGQWWLAVNAHKEPMMCSKHQLVQFGHIYIEFNGWPAGVINPREGCITAGSLANEETLIQALKAKVAA